MKHFSTADKISTKNSSAEAKKSFQPLQSQKSDSVLFHCCKNREWKIVSNCFHFIPPPNFFGFLPVTCNKEIARNSTWQIDLSQTTNTQLGPPTPSHQPRFTKGEIFVHRWLPAPAPAPHPRITNTQTFDKRLRAVRGLLYSHLKNKLNFSHFCENFLNFFSGKIFLQARLFGFDFVPSFSSHLIEKNLHIRRFEHKFYSCVKRSFSSWLLMVVAGKLQI